MITSVIQERVNILRLKDELISKYVDLHTKTPVYSLSADEIILAWDINL